jgi:hypothetical protein
VVDSTDDSLGPQEAGARLDAEAVVGEGGHDCLLRLLGGPGRRLLLPPGDLGLVLRLLQVGHGGEEWVATWLAQHCIIQVAAEGGALTLGGISQCPSYLSGMTQTNIQEAD